MDRNPRNEKELFSMKDNKKKTEKCDRNAAKNRPEKGSATNMTSDTTRPSSADRDRLYDF